MPRSSGIPRTDCAQLVSCPQPAATIPRTTPRLHVRRPLTRVPPRWHQGGAPRRRFRTHTHLGRILRIAARLYANTAPPLTIPSDTTRPSAAPPFPSPIL